MRCACSGSRAQPNHWGRWGITRALKELSGARVTLRPPGWPLLVSVCSDAALAPRDHESPAKGGSARSASRSPGCSSWHAPWSSGRGPGGRPDADRNRWHQLLAGRKLPLGVAPARPSLRAPQLPGNPRAGRREDAAPQGCLSSRILHHRVYRSRYPRQGISVVTPPRVTPRRACIAAWRHHGILSVNSSQELKGMAVKPLTRPGGLDRGRPGASRRLG